MSKQETITLNGKTPLNYVRINIIRNDNVLTITNIDRIKWGWKKNNEIPEKYGGRVDENYGL